MRKEENKKSKVLQLADKFSKSPWNWVLFGVFWLGAMQFISRITSLINNGAVSGSWGILEIENPFYSIGLGISIIVCLVSIAIFLIWAAYLMPKNKRIKRMQIFVFGFFFILIVQSFILIFENKSLLGSKSEDDYYIMTTRFDNESIIYIPQVLTLFDLVYFIKIATKEQLVDMINFFMLLVFYLAMLIYIPIRILKSIKTGKY